MTHIEMLVTCRVIRDVSFVRWSFVRMAVWLLSRMLVAIARECRPRGHSATSMPTNQPSVVTLVRAGTATRAGKKRHPRSARSGGTAAQAVRPTLRLALAERNRELRRCGWNVRAPTPSLRNTVGSALERAEAG